MQKAHLNENWSLLPSTQSVGHLAASSGAVALFVGESARAAGGFRVAAGFRSAGAAWRFAARVRAFLPADILRAVRPFGVVVRRSACGFRVSVPVAPWSVPAALPVSTLAEDPRAIAQAMASPAWQPSAPVWAPFYPPVPIAATPRPVWRRAVVGLHRWVFRAAWHLRRRQGLPFPAALRSAWAAASS